jgi:hypothetical protein
MAFLAVRLLILLALAAPTPTRTVTAAAGETASLQASAIGAGDVPPLPLGCADIQDRLDRLLGLAEATDARLAGRVPVSASGQLNVDFGKSPGAGPIFAIAFAGALLGFVVGTLYGRRQERNRRNRVRL